MRRGFTLVEVLATLSMFLLVMGSTVPVVSWLVVKSKYLQHDASASLLMQEGVEVAYNVLTSDWSASAIQYPEGIYHPAVDASSDPYKWTLLPGDQTNLEARFSRRVEIADVCRRNGSGELVEEACGSGSVGDINSRKITSTVLWTENQQTKSLTSELLITKLER